MIVNMVITGLDELQKRLERFPSVFDNQVSFALQAALYAVWENIPGYPPKPEGSKYVRKVSGGLGGSFGISAAGAHVGKPNIFTVKKEFGGYHTAEFGSRLKYAEFVVGERQPAWNKHWWTIHNTVLPKAMVKINAIFEKMAETLAAFVDHGAI